jgi:hypothetical protein
LACGHRNVIVFTFIEVGLLKVTSYGDDPMRTGHFKLEVSIVGDGNELSITWLAQDGVVGAGEVRYL